MVIAVRSGDVCPHVGKHIILWHTFSSIIHQAQPDLGIDKPQFSRASESLYCRFIILWHAFS